MLFVKIQNNINKQKMSKNIFDICNIKTNIGGNIEINVKYCDNYYCLDGPKQPDMWKFSPKICKNCASIICNRCISNNHDKCVVCIFPNLNIKLSYYKRCKNCLNHIFIYICKKCSKLTLSCDGNCEYSMCEYIRYFGYYCKNCDEYDNSFAKFIKYNKTEYQ